MTFSSGKFTCRIALALVAVLAMSRQGFGQHLHSGASGLAHGIPQFCATPSITSIRSGAWSDPNTWSGSRVPAAGDKVGLGSTHVVTYDTMSNASLECVSVAGTLQFSTSASTRLTVGTLLVLDSGTLQIGAESAPMPGGVTAELVIANRAIDTAFDPEQFGTGLIGLGTVKMFGAARAASFSRLADEAHPGQNTLRFTSVPAGWKAGDRVLVPDSRHLDWNEHGPLWPYVPQWEERTIAQVSGEIVTLSTPLSYEHPGARNGDQVLEFLPHVGDLSRNVIIRSENPAGTRGHVLFSGRANVDIRYAAFLGLGRTTLEPLDSATFDASGNVTHVGTNQIGRYSIHMHHVSGPVTTPPNGAQFTLIGNAIEDGSKWGITVHNSHFGLIQDNLVYKAAGAGIMFEDGSESYNVVEKNFVVGSLGIGGWAIGRGFSDPRDFGVEGTAFWFRGPNNYVRDNVAASSTEYGYAYTMWYLGTANVPKFKGADPNTAGQFQAVDMNALPLLEFARNEIYGATAGGLTIWWLGIWGDDARAAPTSTVQDLTAWHFHTQGYFGYPTINTLFDHVVMRGNTKVTSNPSDGITGMYFGDYVTRNAVVRNSDIQGLAVGIAAPYFPDTRGAIGDNSGLFTVQDSYLRNFANVIVGTMYSTAGASDMPPRKTVISNTKFATVNMDNGRTQRAIRMDYKVENAHNIVQRDLVYVYSYNKVSGDDFQVFYPEQAPDFVVPQTGSAPAPNPDRPLIGAPVAGLTNAQLWAQYQVAVGGGVARCSTVRPEIFGFVCPGIPAAVGPVYVFAPPPTIAAPPASPPSTTVGTSTSLTPPASPTNVRVVQ